MPAGCDFFIQGPEEIWEWHHSEGNANNVPGAPQTASNLNHWKEIPGWTVNHYQESARHQVMAINPLPANKRDTITIVPVYITSVFQQHPSSSSWLRVVGTSW